jgi:hemolysin activation/secretion protein
MLSKSSAYAQTNLSASYNLETSPPTFQVQAYQIDGETFLPPEKLSSALTNYTGTVDMAQISMAAKKLQEVFHQAGYTNISVVIPPQRLTNGIVHLKAVTG